MLQLFDVCVVVLILLYYKAICKIDVHYYVNSIIIIIFYKTFFFLEEMHSVSFSAVLLRNIQVTLLRPFVSIQHNVVFLILKFYNLSLIIQLLNSQLHLHHHS